MSTETNDNGSDEIMFIDHGDDISIVEDDSGTAVQATGKDVSVFYNERRLLRKYLGVLKKNAQDNRFQRELHGRVASFEQMRLRLRAKRMIHQWKTRYVLLSCSFLSANKSGT